MFNQREYIKQWRKDNFEHIKEYKKEYRKNNLEKIKKTQKKWNKDNIYKMSEHYKNKRKTDLKFNLNYRMGIAIWKSLRKNKAGRKWEILVGYTLDDLIKRLKKTMPKGYKWQDYLEGRLHIDHKIPKSIYNFTKYNHMDFKRCWALSNLQLLPPKENLIKNSKLTRPFQPALKI